MRRRCTWVLVLAALTPPLVGCDDATSPTPAPAQAHPSLYSTEGLRLALLSFETRLGTPVHSLSLRVLPDRALLQAESKTRANSVEQFEYVDGHLLGPTQVALQGQGKLADNLFLLRSANLDQLPSMVRKAQQAAGADNVTLVTLRRGLPQTAEPRFFIEVTVHGEPRVLEASGQGELQREP